MELKNTGGVGISLMFTSDSCSKLIHSPYKSSATLSHLLVKVVCLHAPTTRIHWNSEQNS